MSERAKTASAAGPLRTDRRPRLRPGGIRVYWDEAALHRETARVFDVCAGCRMCFKYCDAFPEAVRGRRRRTRRRRPRADAGRRPRPSSTTASSASSARSTVPTRRATTTRSRSTFPKLALRHQAQRARARGLTLRDRVLANPDAVGLAARLGRRPRQPAQPQHRAPPAAREDAGHPPRQAAAGVRAANVRGVGGRREADRARARRRDRPLPDLSLRRQQQAGDRPRRELEVLRANGVDVRCVRGLGCCGMPAWESGDSSWRSAGAPAGTSTSWCRTSRRAAPSSCWVRRAASCCGASTRRWSAPATGNARASWPRPYAIRPSCWRRSTGSRGRPPRSRRGPKASPITWPATSARRRSAFRPATSCGARVSRASSPSENAAATTAATR